LTINLRLNFLKNRIAAEEFLKKKLGLHFLGLILSKPVYFWRSLGTKTEPSFC